MIRNFVRLLVLIFVFAIIRSIIGMITRTVSQIMKPSEPAQAPRQASGVRSAGELRKDPVCGTFVSAETSITKKVGGELLHFCSADCRDKYRVA